MIARLSIGAVLVLCLLLTAVPLFSVRCTVDTSTGGIPAAFLVCSARLP